MNKEIGTNEAQREQIEMLSKLAEFSGLNTNKKLSASENRVVKNPLELYKKRDTMIKAFFNSHITPRNLEADVIDKSNIASKDLEPPQESITERVKL